MIRNEWQNALGFVGTGCVAFAGLGILGEASAPLVIGFFVVGVCLTAASGVINVVRRRRWFSLMQERTAAIDRSSSRTRSIQRIFDGMLIALAREMAISLGNARASLYIQVDQGLVLISRVSDHPAWRERGRSAYPLDQGAIGAAWTKSRSVQVDLPVDRDEWNNRMVDFGIPYEVAQGLTMQSLSIAARRIDTIAVKPNPVAIVVIEGERQRTVNARLLDELERSHAWELICIAVSQSEEIAEVALEVRDTPTSRTGPVGRIA